MKTVFFLRHGQSEGNVSDRWQEADSPLTDLGVEQARLAGNRLSSKKVDVIVSSDMKRALQTADAIADVLKKPVLHSELFNERRRPSEQLGELKESPDARDAELLIKTYFHDPAFRFSDEENFCDLKSRAEELFKYIESLEHENIVIVSHEILLRIILSYIAFGSDVTGEEAKQFFRTFHMENTGITTVRENKGDNKSNWDLLTWNDYSHLENTN